MSARWIIAGAALLLSVTVVYVGVSLSSSARSVGRLIDKAETINVEKFDKAVERTRGAIRILKDEWKR